MAIVEAPTNDPEPFDSQCVFSVIERTAETLRWLHQENKVLAERERACQEDLERNRELWRADVDSIILASEACLTRAVQAEKDATESRTQAERAIFICKEARQREKDAIERAESAENRARIAEQWLELISQRLTTDLKSLLTR